MKYSAEQLQFLQEGYKKMRVPELTSAFNKKFKVELSPCAIKSTIKRKGFKCGRPPGFKKGESLSIPPHQVKWLKDNYPGKSRIEITEAFNKAFNLDKSLHSITAFLKNHKIISGRTGCFEKGHETWNKGTKGLTSANKTSFKKGQSPANIKAIGHERICSKDGYILVKINEPNPYTNAKTRYKAKHIVEWEKHNGQIPEGHIVTFLSGDKLNCDIDNLECISKAENVRRNKLQYSKQPAELQPVVRTLAKLITRSSELERDNA